MFKNRTKRMVGALALTAACTAGVVAQAGPAVGDTPAQSVTADFVSSPFHISFTASRPANAPATDATGTFNAVTSLGTATVLTLAGPVTCLDIVGNQIGLFYAVGKADPDAVYAAIHGIYIYVTDSSSGKPEAVNFVPSTSNTAKSCAPLPGLFPITSGTATIDPPAAAPAAITTTLGAASNASLGKTIVVDATGQTVYELKPETSRHTLCTKANGCFKIWHPMTVASAKTKLTAATGIKGKLGILHRNGIFQVTLGGHPLYRFTGDGGKAGAAGGQGLKSFHGTWHVVTAKGAATTSTPAPTTPTPPPAYPYA